MRALVVAFFAVQAGYHGFTASLPVALVKGGLPDAQIGLIVGVASVIQVPAAFFAGGLIDRFGGPRVLLFGCLSYLAAAVLLALPIAEPGGSGAIPIFVVARIFQGIGVSTTTPAAFAVVPGLVTRTRVGVGLAQAGAAQNLTMAIFPPLSLFVLDVTGLHGVAALIAAVVAVGALLALRLQRSLERTHGAGGAAAAANPPPPLGRLCVATGMGAAAPGRCDHDDPLRRRGQRTSPRWLSGRRQRRHLLHRRRRGGLRVPDPGGLAGGPGPATSVRACRSRRPAGLRPAATECPRRRPCSWPRGSSPAQAGSSSSGRCS